MISHTTSSFLKLYESLPKNIQKQAKKAYARFIRNPYHPSLYFKRIHSIRPIYSVRISKEYRAVGIQENNEIIWYWIGSHSEYDKLITQLRNV